MMKARQYDRRIFSRGIQPHVYAIAESNDIDAYTRDYFTNNDPKLKAALDSIINDLQDAKEYGSILTVTPVDFAPLYARMDEVQNDISLYREAAMATVLSLIRVAEVLAQQYDVVVTNPPYMGSGNMDARLSEFVKKHYPDSKSDLFAVFIERCGQMTGKNRYQAMITQHAWMFLSSFEKLRAKLLLKDTVNMAHLGPRAFEEIGGEVVQTTSFVLRNSHIADYKGTYCRLIEPTTQQGKEEMFLSGENCYTAQQSNFTIIPGSPVAYWGTEKQIEVFNIGQPLSALANPRQGLITGDVNRFVRKWYECSTENLNFTATRDDTERKGKWFPYNNGGEFRKWYGNNEDVVNWYLDGMEIKNFTDEKGKQRSRPQNQQYYFIEGGTWTAISSSALSVRYFPEGFIFSNAGMGIYTDNIKLKYIISFLNSKLSQLYLGLFNGGLNYNQGDIAKLPIVIEKPDCIVNKVNENIILSKSDWDSNETSWDFRYHPLAPFVCERQEPEISQFNSSRMGKFSRIAWHYEKWVKECEDRFEQLKANEEELNRIFIDIYGLQKEITPEVEDKEVTVRKADLQRDIKSLLSYAVGCMFGRYSLDTEGLAYAGGNWDKSKYKTFLPDEDGVIPITDEEYLEDDIVIRLCNWLKVVYGEDTLEENLDFIAKALGNRGNSSREIIRNYFLKDFFKDHCKIYQKRPVYWLFDSGKQNGFKALIYLHLYTPDTIGNLRVDYLHKMQRVYESEIGRMQDMIDHSTNAREVATATKRKEKLQKQIKECRDYDEMIAHLALSRIELDLDDGVKVNYEKVQTASDGKKYPVLAKI